MLTLLTPRSVRDYNCGDVAQMVERMLTITYHLIPDALHVDRSGHLLGTTSTGYYIYWVLHLLGTGIDAPHLQGR